MSQLIWERPGVHEALKALIEKKKVEPDFSYSNMAAVLNAQFPEVTNTLGGFTRNMVLSKVRRSGDVPEPLRPKRSAGLVPAPPRARRQTRARNSNGATKDVRDVTGTDPLQEMLKQFGFDEVPGMLKLSAQELLKHEIEFGIICCRFGISESLESAIRDERFCGHEIGKEGKEKFLKSRFCPAHRMRVNRGYNHSGKVVIPADSIKELRSFLESWRARLVAPWAEFCKALASIDATMLMTSQPNSSHKRNRPHLRAVSFCRDPLQNALYMAEYPPA